MSGAPFDVTLTKIQQGLDVLMEKLSRALKLFVRNNSIRRRSIVLEDITDDDIDTIVRDIGAKQFAYIERAASSGIATHPDTMGESIKREVAASYGDGTMKASIASLITSIQQNLLSFIITDNIAYIRRLDFGGLLGTQLKARGYTVTKRTPATAGGAAPSGGGAAGGAGGGGARAPAAAAAATSVIPCVVCGKPATVRCAACTDPDGLEGWYCGEKCQIVDWKITGVHKAYHRAAAATKATKEANNGDPKPSSERKSRKARRTRKHRF